MLYHKKILTFFFIAFFIVGCSTKTSHPVVTPKPSTHATMRPYKINGKTYYPQKVEVGETQKGLASWYGPNFHGKSTANGERYNMYAQTAAHKTFPMNT
ncbi:septal ring lytic transglycosylase RlpA family protein, partial [Campylobacter ureolyticus]